MCSPLNIVSHKSIEVNIRVKTFVSLLKFAGLRLDCIALTEWYLHHMWHLVELQENWWLLVVFITDITLDCITDITFVCIPKISLSSEFDTEHTGLVLFPHSQGEEGGEAGRREVLGVFLRSFHLAHIGACAWHVHASVVSDGTICTCSVTAVNFCQTLLPGTSDGQLQSHAFPHMVFVSFTLAVIADTRFVMMKTSSAPPQSPQLGLSRFTTGSHICSSLHYFWWSFS